MLVKYSVFDLILDKRSKTVLFSSLIINKNIILIYYKNHKLRLSSYIFLKIKLSLLNLSTLCIDLNKKEYNKKIRIFLNNIFGSLKVSKILLAVSAKHSNITARS